MSTSADAAPSPRRAARPLRRDAERNRRLILEAAAELFAERGLTATLDDVAVRAGVGVGTVYRRFPDKASLVDALFDDRLADHAVLVEAAEGGADPGAALLETIETLAERFAADQALREVILGAARRSARLGQSLDRINSAMARLLARAQDAGVVRADLSPTDIPLLLVMLGSLAELGRPVYPDLWRRHLPLLLDAIRTRGGEPEPLTHPALDIDQLTRALEAPRPRNRPSNPPR